MKRVTSLIICSVFALASCRDEVPMEHHEEHQHEQNQIYLTVREQQLAGIMTDTAAMGEIKVTKNLVGIVTVNESKTGYVSSRIKGRIERLFIRSLNEYVKQGSPVAEIYSEQLFADEQNYLNLFQNKTPEGILLAASARKRLELWGLTPTQILVLENTNAPSATQTIVSTQSGIVSAVFVTQGEYVEIGTKLLEVNDISSVWIEAQLYPDEVSGIYTGSSASIIIADIPSQTFSATPVFRNPVLEEGSKIYLLRYELQNFQNQIRPGMQATIELSSTNARGLMVSRSSLVTGEEPSVWVELSSGLFEKRMVNVGVSNTNMVEILSGVYEGELVVSSGVYLLNSEFILRNGANSMGGMKM